MTTRGDKVVWDASEVRASHIEQTSLHCKAAQEMISAARKEEDRAAEITPKGD